MAIATLGFRGEALPSIGSVARLSITTRHASEPNAWTISVDGGDKSDVRPAALSEGTRIEVRDLFYATPARLKFLKADRTESEAIRDTVRRLAMSRPGCCIHACGRGTRAGDVAGGIAWRARPAGAARRHSRRGFSRQCGRGAWRARGAFDRRLRRACRPTRAPTRCRNICSSTAGRCATSCSAGAVRGAYADYLPRDRHPVVALFVTVDPREVDVNVHPAKAEVRFRDAGLVRASIVRSLHEALARDSSRAATTGGTATVAAFRSGARRCRARLGLAQFAGAAVLARCRARTALAGFAEAAQAAFDVGAPSADARIETVAPAADLIDRPLGAARAQIHETYIVAQTRDGVVIVDQHAAHERLVYEKMKASLEKSGVARQILLIPEIVELDEADVARLAARGDELARFGLVLEAVWSRRGRGARDAVDAGRNRCRRAGARSRRAHGGMGRGAAARTPPDACRPRRWRATARCAPDGGSSPTR